MRGVDTTVLVRYITDDDREQAEAVERFLQQCHRDHERIFVSVLVLCELIWVLDRSFEESKPRLIEVLERLLATDLFQIDQESAVRHSLEHYRLGKAGFPDYMIGEIGRLAGCRDTVSFDRALRGSPGFELLV